MNKEYDEAVERVAQQVRVSKSHCVFDTSGQRADCPRLHGQPEYDCCICHARGIISGLEVKADDQMTLPDNQVWHRNEREFEAYCSGKNDMVSDKWVKVVEKK